MRGDMTRHIVTDGLVMQLAPLARRGGEIKTYLSTWEKKKKGDKNSHGSLASLRGKVDPFSFF
jgi:hypothetical protein